MAESFDALLKRRMAEHAERDFAARKERPDGAKEATERKKENNRKHCRKWRKENPEKHAEHCRKWRENNPEKCAQSSKKYRETHPEDYAAQRKHYYDANRGKILAKVKKWYRENSERAKGNARKNRERHRAAFIAANKACPFCGLPTEVVLYGKSQRQRVVCTGCGAYASTGMQGAGWKIHKEDRRTENDND